MATFLERDAHFVYRMLSLYFDIIILVIYHFGFAGGTLVLIASVPDHCISCTFYKAYLNDDTWLTLTYFPQG